MRSGKLYIALYLILIPFLVTGQVESTSTIIFTNPNDSLRTADGLSFPSNDSSGLNAHTLVSGTFYYGNSSGQLIQLQFTPVYTNLLTGMYFNIKFDQANYANTFIQIDQLPPVELLNYDLTSPDSGIISPGEIITCIYNGNSFVMMNPPQDKCPSGFVKINNRFCMESNERSATDFFSAVSGCNASGFEVCGYNDWFQACLYGSGLNNMTDNYEWVNNAGNSATTIKVMGMNSAGVTGCTRTYTIYFGNLNAYRCCYYLKK